MPASRTIWCALGFLTITFHVTLVFSGLISPLVSRPLHMALALPWVLIALATTPASRISGAVLTLAGVIACAYVAWSASALGDQYGYIQGTGQHVLAWTLIVVVLETARRAIGWPLPLVTVLALAYGLYGQHIPGEFGHPGLPVGSFLGTMTIAEGGLWGTLTGVSVEIVAIFVIFGAVLNAGEAGQGFMNLASAAAGRLRGGAAKVSVISSALFGSISGSASANVASTGAITLPAMLRLGYPKALAGAVEAVASSGGQIMPPLMGAGAFVMVELTGVSYQQIMLAALLPAILFFVAVWAGIDAFSRRHDLKALPAELLPTMRTVGITTAFFLVPFAVLLERMFAGGYTPQYAACVAGGVALVALNLDAKGTFNWRRSVFRLQEVCLSSGRQISTIAAIILCASLIIGVLGQTGLGVKMTSAILAGSGGSLWPALGLTALACLLLGMEVPTTAAYVICVSVAGPALADLGLDLLLVHLFVFWYALLSTITPPVCGTVFIAAGMVGENWLKVSVRALALGIGLYLIPLAMVAQPALIELGDNPLAALAAAARVGAGLWLISMSVIAPGRVALRIPGALAGLMLVLW